MKSITVFDKLIWSCFALIAILIGSRILVSGSSRYVFLVWNIFLAWLPYIFSTMLNQNRFNTKWKQWLLGASWLLFFPNALYIVIDLVHLRADTNIPWWFDTMLLF